MGLIFKLDEDDVKNVFKFILITITIVLSIFNLLKCLQYLLVFFLLVLVSMQIVKVIKQK